MLDLRKVVLSVLEDGEYDLSMRPINTPWNSQIFLALIIPQVVGSEYKVIEFNYLNGAAFWINQFNSTHNNVAVIDPGHRVDFNLADPKDYEKLEQYLEEVCYGNHAVVEFEDSLDLDYLTVSAR